MPVGYTILLLSAKQSRENQCNEASRLKKNVSEELSVIYPLEMRRSPFAIEFTTFAAKNHNLFVKFGSEKELEKKELCGHRLIMHSVTHRGGECER